MASLKYLEFLPIAITKVTACIIALYGYSKDSCGPLKPCVDSTEGIVRMVMGPIYQKIEGKPFEVLVFVDQTVGNLIQFLDGVLPQKVKDTDSQAYDVARLIVSDFQMQGIYSMAKGYYEKYEPVAKSYGIKVYKKAITLPLLPQAISFTRFVVVKVNNVIGYLKTNGLPFVGYLPLLPVR